MGKDSDNIFTFCGNAKTNHLCSCGFANIPGSGNLLINYDGGESYDFTPFGNDFISLGNTPPRKELIINQGTIGMPGAILTPTILANGRVESYTKIIFVEWFGGTIGSPVELYVIFIYDFSYLINYRSNLSVKLIE